MKKINTAVVIGAGTMGSGIASHLANVDCDVYLLDLPGKNSRNEITEKAITNIKKSDPPLLFHKQKLNNIIHLFKQKWNTTFFSFFTYN